MSSSKECLEFVLEQLSLLDEVTSRAMMGEYLLYYRGRLFGGIYDDRLLVKPVEAVKAYLPNAALQPPYDGAKEMVLVDELENKEYLRGLVEAMYPELSDPKPKKKRKNARKI